MNNHKGGVARLRQLGKNLAIDRAVALALAGRLWQFVAGPVTVVLIASFFPKETQGYFYTFASLLAIQTFFDLGLTSVLLTVSSHEWGVLQHADQQDRRTAQSRLALLVRGARRWYGLCALAFFAITSLVGYLFFSAQNEAAVAWEAPWLGVVLLTAASLWLSPSIAILEGCNYVAAVNLFRTAQAVLGNLAVWTAILLGWGLWASVASAAVRLACESWLVGVQFRPFFRELRMADPWSPSFSWSVDVLPLQWRLALQSLATYFALQIFTPVIFHYHGPIQAGRMGMTWTIITTLQMSALCWVQPRLPSFGASIAAQRFDELIATYRRTVRISTAVFVTGAASFLAVLAALPWIWPKLADRMLDLPTSGMLALAFLANHRVHCLGAFVRAHKVDPFVWIGLGVSSLGAVSIWLLGAKYGAMGAASAHAAVMTLIALPIYHFIATRMMQEDQQRITAANSRALSSKR